MTGSSGATIAFAVSSGRLGREPMKHRNIIQGGRADLERELLEALFTPGAEPRVHDLKTRLAPRGQGKLRLVADGTREHASPEACANSGLSKE
jgi:hypothetical protein